MGPKLAVPMPVPLIVTEPLIGSSNLCVPSLQPFGVYPYGSCPGLGLIGAPFFHEQFVVFNQAEPSVSYAPYA